MIYTQINITNEGKKFPYAFEYVDEDYFVSDLFSYSIIPASANSKEIVFYNTDSHITNLLRNKSVWNINTSIQTTDYLPRINDDVSLNISSLNLYFPTFSVDTYYPQTKYAVKISTYINGCKVTLASYLINRKDALAIPTGPKIFKNRKYYEYIKLYFVDPWFVTYDDSWAEFRQMVCQEPAETNNTGSIIDVELFPITKQSTDYIMADGYVGGVGSILFSNDPTSNLHLNLSCNCFERPDLDAIGTSETSPHFEANIVFNDIYQGNLTTYLYETYGIDLNSGDYTMCYEMVLKNEDSIYKYIKHSVDTPTISNIFEKRELDIRGWSEFLPGCSFLATYTITDNSTGEDIILIYSNTIPATPEIFKYFIFTGAIDFVNINEIDMNNYTVDVVNKVEQNIISVARPDDYKNNILRPIFIQTSKADNIIVHPMISENIAINLDAYKQSVDVFYLQIEGQDFVEIGRTAYGVIFKVVGKLLPNEVTSGLYYILDTEKNLVTTGKYKYEM